MATKFRKSLAVFVLLAFLSTLLATSYLATDDDDVVDEGAYTQQMTAVQESDQTGGLTTTEEQGMEGPGTNTQPTTEGATGEATFDEGNTFNATSLPFTYEELEEEYSSIFLFDLSPTGGEVAPGSKTEVILTLANTAGQGDTARSFLATQVRLYPTGDAASYLDLEAIDGTEFSYAGQSTTFILDEEEDGTPYLVATLAGIGGKNNNTRAATLPLTVKGSQVPDGATLGLRLEFWYQNGEEGFSKLSNYTGEIEFTTISTLLWSTTAKAGNAVTVEGDTYETPLTFTMAVKDEGSDWAAEEFTIADTLTLPEGLSLPSASAITVKVAGAVKEDAVITFDEASGSYLIEFTHAASKGFTYTVSFEGLLAGEPEFNHSWEIGYTPTLKVKGINSDTPIAMAAYSASQVIDRPFKDFNVVEEIGDGSVSLKKTRQLEKDEDPNTPNLYIHGDKVTFLIDGFAFDKPIPTPLALTDLYITDYNWTKCLEPVSISIGEFTDSTGPITPDAIVLTVDKQAYRYPVGSETSYDIENILTFLELDPASTVTAIELLFEETDTDFAIKTPIAITFKVNDERTTSETGKDESFAGYTATNSSTVRYTHTRGEDYLPVEYTTLDYSTVAQIAGNYVPSVEFEKGSKGTFSPGKTITYTISFTNNSAFAHENQRDDFIIRDPMVRDDLPTDYLDISTLQIKSVSKADLSLEDGNHTNLMGHDTVDHTLCEVKDEKTFRLEWHFKGDLAPGETVTITYTVQIKTKIQLEAAGLWHPGQTITIQNRAWLTYRGWHEHWEPIETDTDAKDQMTIAKDQPYVNLSLGVAAPYDSQSFLSSTQVPVTFVAKAQNDHTFDENERPSNIDKLVLEGVLPEGFTFDHEASDLASLFNISHSRFIDLNSALTASVGENNIITYKDEQDLTGWSSVTIEVFEGKFYLTIEGSKDAPVLKHGQSHEADQRAGESITVTFTGLSSEKQGFTNAYSDSFIADAYLYLWNTQAGSYDAETGEGKDWALTSLNNSSEGAYRFHETNVTYVARKPSPAIAEVAGGLHVSTTVKGQLDAPLISFEKKLATDSSIAQAGEILTYTLTLTNHSRAPLSIADLDIADWLPEGQEYCNSGDHRAIVQYGERSYYLDEIQGLVRKYDHPFSDDANGLEHSELYFDFDVLTNQNINIQLAATPVGDDPANLKLQPDSITLTYYTKVQDEAHSMHNVPDYAATHDVENVADLLILSTSDTAFKYDNGKAVPFTSADSFNSSGSIFTDIDKYIDQANETDAWWMLEDSADVTYTRDRISPDLTKTLVAPPASIFNNKVLTWQLQVKNIKTDGQYTLANTGLEDFYLIDIIPAELQLLVSSVSAGANRTAELVAQTPITYNFTASDGLEDLTHTGDQPATLMIWKITGNALEPGDSFTFTYQTTVALEKPDEVASYGIFVNEAWVLPSAAQQDAFIPYDGNNISRPDYDLDLYGDLESVYSDIGSVLSAFAASSKAVHARAEVGIWGEDKQLLYKQVILEDENGDTTIALSSDTNGNQSVEVQPGQRFEYALNLQNASLVPGSYSYSGVTLIDRFPFFGDIAVRTGQARKSEFRPVVMALDDAGTPDITVWLLDQYNGDRLMDEAEYTLTYMLEKDAKTNLPDTAKDWTNATGGSISWASSVSDPSAIYGIRVMLNTTLEVGQTLQVVVGMQVPEDVTVSSASSSTLLQSRFTAWNSVAAKGQSSSPGGTTTGLLVPETTGVGVSISNSTANSLQIEKLVKNAKGEEVEDLSGLSFTFQLTGPGGLKETLVLDGTNGFSTSLQNLPLGSYTLKEVADGEGNDISTLYDTAMELVDELGNTISINKGSFKIDRLPARTYTLRVTNTQKAPTLTLQKLVDGVASPLAKDVAFHLLDEAMQLVASGVTDAEGVLTFTGNIWGSYILAEVVAEGSPLPAGFTLYEGETPEDITLAEGESLYIRSVSLPGTQMGGVTVLAGTLTVNNITEGTTPPEFSIQKAWNGTSEADGSAAFLLLPEGSNDLNAATLLTGNGIRYTAVGLAPGSYDLYEITAGKYKPKTDGGEWELLEETFTYGEWSGTLWKYSDVIEFENADLTLRVDNTFTVPPVEPPVEPSSSSGGGTGSSSVPTGSSSRPTGSSSTGGTGSSELTGDSSSEGGGGGEPDPGPSPSSSTVTGGASSSRPAVSSTSRTSSSSSSSSSTPASSGTGSSSDAGSSSGTEPGTGGGDGDGNGTDTGEGGTGTGTGTGTGSTYERAGETLGEAFSNNLQTILNGDTPLGSLTFGGAWSLLNLICGLLATFISIILIITTLFEKRKKPEQQAAENNENEIDAASTEDDDAPEADRIRQRNKLIKICTIAVGLLSMMLFLIGEDLLLPVTWITKWTPIVVPTFLIHIILLVVYRLLVKKENLEEDDEDLPAPEGV